MNEKLKDIEAELAQVGGVLEWTTDVGVGVSFPATTTNNDFGRLNETINHAVWINLENTCITDATLEKLEEAPVLESIRIAHTSVTAVALKRFLSTTPTLREVVLSCGQLSQDDLASLQSVAPNVHFTRVD